MGKLRVGVLTEDLELTDAYLFRKEVASKPIAALTLGIVRVIAAQPVVVGILAFDRNGAGVGQFLFH